MPCSDLKLERIYSEITDILKLKDSKEYLIRKAHIEQYNCSNIELVFTQKELTDFECGRVAETVRFGTIYEFKDVKFEEWQQNSIIEFVKEHYTKNILEVKIS